MARRRSRKKKKKSNYEQVLSMTRPVPIDRTKLVNWDYHRSLANADSGHHTRINELNPREMSFGQITKGNCDGPLSAEKLIAISESILFDSAIEQISNGVAQMKWVIEPPEEMELGVTLDRAKALNFALSKPNHEDNSSYRQFIKSCVRNLLIFNKCPVQRQSGEDHHPFWLWDENPQEILRNKNWHPSVSGLTPKYYHDPLGNRDPKHLQPIMADNMFVIQHKVSAYKRSPRSPVEVAYYLIRAWLGLGEYQERITSKAVRDYLIALGQEIDDVTLQRLKSWWREDVEGSGEVPIFGGQIQVHKFGAKDDSELFAQYKDHLGGLIALAFGLSQKDFNIEMKSGDNRATANVTADLSYQNSILPMSDSIAEALNNEVIDFYAPKYKFTISDREYRGEQAEAETASLLYTSGIITQNEARSRVGVDPLEEGSELVQPELEEKEAKEVKVSEDRKEEVEERNNSREEQAK